jgi:hypothetical protein
MMHEAGERTEGESVSDIAQYATAGNDNDLHGDPDPAAGALSRQARDSSRELIHRMSKENPLWGAPRIHGELLKLGFEIAESTSPNT